MTIQTVPDTLEQVRLFMTTAGQHVPTEPTQPARETLLLRLSLELEELFEKAQAMGLEGTFSGMLAEKAGLKHVADYKYGKFYEGGIITSKDTDAYDPIALLDACIDQRYVQDGTVLACGLQDAFYPGFAIVQASNMSKFCHTEQEVRDTLAKYAAEGVEVWVSTPFFPEMYPAAILRKLDKKVLKNAHYIAADLTTLFPTQA
jgi:predicted HAD superfamily Cof-like phosphohydrolase